MRDGGVFNGGVALVGCCFYGLFRAELLIAERREEKRQKRGKEIYI